MENHKKIPWISAVLIILYICGVVATNPQAEQEKKPFMCLGVDICHAKGVVDWQYCDATNDKRCRFCKWDKDLCFTANMPGNCTRFCTDEVIKRERVKGCPPLNQTNHGLHNGSMDTRQKHGDVITLQCDAGYHCYESCRITCSDYGYYKGSLECKEVFCPAFPSPKKLKVQPDRNKYRVNEIVYFSCGEDGNLDGPSYARCASDGSWNVDTTPVCIEDEIQDLLIGFVSGCVPTGILLVAGVCFCLWKYKKCCFNKKRTKQSNSRETSDTKDYNESAPFIPKDKVSTDKVNAEVKIVDEKGVPTEEKEPLQVIDEQITRNRVGRSGTDPSLMDRDKHELERHSNKASTSFPDVSQESSQTRPVFSTLLSESEDSGFSGNSRKGSRQDQFPLIVVNIDSSNSNKQNYNVTNNNSLNNTMTNNNKPNITMTNNSTASTTPLNNPEQTKEPIKMNGFTRSTEYCGHPTEECGERKECHAEINHDSMNDRSDPYMIDTDRKSMLDQPENPSDNTDTKLGEQFNLITPKEEEGKHTKEGTFHAQPRDINKSGKAPIVIGDREIRQDDIKGGHGVTVAQS